MLNLLLQLQYFCHDSVIERNFFKQITKIRNLHALKLFPYDCRPVYLPMYALNMTLITLFSGWSTALCVVVFLLPCFTSGLVDDLLMIT